VGVRGQLRHREFPELHARLQPLAFVTVTAFATSSSAPEKVNFNKCLCDAVLCAGVHRLKYEQQRAPVLGLEHVLVRGQPLGAATEYFGGLAFVELETTQRDRHLHGDDFHDRADSRVDHRVADILPPG
jgi:hypothetical protein